MFVFVSIVRVVVFGFGLFIAYVGGYGLWLSATRDRARVMSAPLLLRLWAFAYPTAYVVSGGLFMAAAVFPADQMPLLIAAAAVWVLRDLAMRVTGARMLEQIGALDR